MLAALVLAGCPATTTPPGPGSAGGPTPTPADHTIELLFNQGPIPRTRPLSIGREESVEWKNSDGRAHTIRFTDWPFRELQEDIELEAGQTSKKFHMYKYQDQGKYSYGIFPPIKGDPGVRVPGASQALGTGPPDPPDIRGDP